MISRHYVAWIAAGVLALAVAVQPAEALPERSALYVQFNQVLNDSAETLPASGVRLWNVLEAQKPENLILDVRHNTGGSTSLYPDFCAPSSPTPASRTAKCTC